MASVTGPVSPAEAQTISTQGGSSAASPVTTPTSQSVNTPTDFAHALLQYMGLPDTDANVQALVAWAAAEGGNWNNTAAYNPFNTTQTMPGSQVMPGGNSAGVQAYTSWEQGIEATAKTLEYPAYSQIVAALRAGNNAGAVAHAVTTSPWGTHVINLGAASSYANTTGGPGGGGIVTSTGNVDANGNAPPYDPNTQYPVTTTQEEQWLQTYAPQYAWLLSDPQVANVVAYAKQYGLTDVTGLLQQTDWWKSHSASQRNWQQIYANDPTSAAKLIHDAQTNVQAVAGRLGVTLTQDQINTLAIDYNYFGLTDQELQRAIGQYSTTAKPSANLSSLQQAANQYLVQIPDQTLQQWLTGINSGTMTQENVDAQLKQLAAGKFPWMAQQIQAGMTPQQILGPYASEIASTLQIDPSNINFNDPRWAKLTYNVDPKTGQQVQTPLWQTVQTVKSDPSYGWAKTPDGQNAQYDVAAQLTKLMGSVA